MRGLRTERKTSTDILYSPFRFPVCAACARRPLKTLTAPAKAVRRAHSRTPNVRKLTSGNPYVSCRIPVLAPKAYIRTSRVRERGEENENWIKTEKTARGTADGFHH